MLPELLEADRYFDDGKYNDAVKLLRSVIVHNPDNDTAYAALARCLYKLGQYDAAIDEAKIALRLNSESAASYYVIGSAYLRKDDYKEARIALEKSLEISPSSEAYISLGALEQRLGHIQEAIEATHNAIHIDPKDWMSHYNLASIDMQRTKRFTAVKEMSIAFQLKPSIRLGAEILLALDNFIQYPLVVVFTFTELALYWVPLKSLLPILIFFLVEFTITGILIMIVYRNWRLVAYKLLIAPLSLIIIWFLVMNIK